MQEKDLWYKRAVVYALDIKTFQDSNGDGIGDFQGLIGRLDYLATLGITCIWLLPFYPSPNRDNGYDVMDYYNVDSRLGNLGDFAALIRQAGERGMRVLVDLVINHTSDQHPWFQQARRDKNSPFRNYYIWSDTMPEELIALPAFPGQQDSVWTWDDEAQAFYFHRFYEHQPDLNIGNPEVVREIFHIMDFWLTLGISGFRIDAAHMLVQSDTSPAKDKYYGLIEDMRKYITMHSRDAILLAEASGPPEVVGSFFKDEDRMHMMFNFLLNQHLFLALAKQEAAPLTEGLRLLPPKSEFSQWLNFLRHHDELNLEDLKPSEKEFAFNAFAPDEDMRIFGRGIRRRLPPMLQGNRQWLELAYSLLFTLPGTPMIQYGAEIGMGDDLSLPGRTSVRTPMQWSGESNAGFSAAPAGKLLRPVISRGAYAYTSVNVVQQQRQPDSLLNWMERVIRMKRQIPELGDGSCKIIDTGHQSVFAHFCTLVYSSVIVHNLSDVAGTVTLPILVDDQQHLVEMFSNDSYALPQQGQVDIGPYGYRWFRMHPKGKKQQQQNEQTGQIQ